MNKQLIYQITEIYKIFKESDFTFENFLFKQMREQAAVLLRNHNSGLHCLCVFVPLGLETDTVLKSNFLDFDNVYISKSK